MTTQIACLTTHCPAMTIYGEIVMLPVGAEISASRSEIAMRKAALDIAGKMPTARFMVRCPGAKNSAPYVVDVDALMIAVGD